MAANKKDQVLCLMLGALDDLDKAWGIKRTSGRIEKELARAGVPGEEIETLGINLSHFTPGVAAGTFQELGSHAVGVGVAGFADVVDEKLQIDSRLRAPTYAPSVPVP
jgi:hypothetical protein